MIIQKEEKGAFYKPPFFISYLITDPEIFGNSVEVFEKTLTKTLELHSVDIICFRDKTSPNKEQLALLCLTIARKFAINKVLINSDVNLCNKYKFDGIHLNSQQFNLLSEMKRANLYTIISCHNEQEIIFAKNDGADAITYSPIFFKEHKGIPKGIDNLKLIIDKYQNESFSIIALGGIIDDKHISKVVQTGARGFASIRYFKV